MTQTSGFLRLIEKIKMCIFWFKIVTNYGQPARRGQVVFLDTLEKKRILIFIVVKLDNHDEVDKWFY